MNFDPDIPSSSKRRFVSPVRKAAWFVLIFSAFLYVYVSNPVQRHFFENATANLAEARRIVWEELPRRDADMGKRFKRAHVALGGAELLLGRLGSGYDTGRHRDEIARLRQELDKFAAAAASQGGAGA